MVPLFLQPSQFKWQNEKFDGQIAPLCEWLCYLATLRRGSENSVKAAKYRAHYIHSSRFLVHTISIPYHFPTLKLLFKKLSVFERTISFRTAAADVIFCASVANRFIMGLLFYEMFCSLLFPKKGQKGPTIF